MKTGLFLIAGSVGVGFLTITIMTMTVMGNGENPVAYSVMYIGGGIAVILLLTGLGLILRSLF